MVVPSEQKEEIIGMGIRPIAKNRNGNGVYPAKQGHWMVEVPCHEMIELPIKHYGRRIMMLPRASHILSVGRSFRP
ncbi:hypothetical protein S83_046831 [Arachis hypogaea]